MKRLFVIFVSICICFSPLWAEADTDISQYSNIVYVQNIETAAGIDTTLSIQMNNTDQVIGFNFKLYLPEGVSVISTTDDWGDVVIDANLRGSRTNSTRHTFETALNKDGILNVLCYSTKTNKFVGTSGEVAYIGIHISDKLTAGKYPIIIKNEAISLSSSTPQISYIQSALTIKQNQPTQVVITTDATNGSVSGGGTYDINSQVILTATPNENYYFVQWSDGNTDNPRTITATQDANYTAEFSPSGSEDDTDISQYNNIVYVQSIAASAGIDTTLSIQMNNVNPVIGFNFKLYLPEGVSVVSTTDDWGDVVIDANLRGSRTNSTRHTFETALNSEGVLNVLCYSTKMNKFVGTSGEVAYVKIHISDQMAAGNYPIIIKNEAISLETSTPQISIIQSTLTIKQDAPGPTSTVHCTVINESPFGTVSFTGEVVKNSKISLKATAPECSKFVKWSDNTTSNPRAITVTQDTTLTAIFEKIQYTITIETDDPNKGDVNEVKEQ